MTELRPGRPALWANSEDAVNTTSDEALQEWPSTTYLGSLAPESRAMLLALGRRRVISDGQIFITMGDESQEVFVILHGVARVESPDAQGRLQVVDFQVRGDTIGVAAAMRHSPRSATVRATGEFVAIEIPGEDFIKFLMDNPPAHFALTQVMLARDERRKTYRLDTNQYDALTLVTRTLIELADRHGTSTEHGIDLDPIIAQTDLAPLSGVSESAVHKALHTLRTEGVMGRGRLRLTITDIDALRRQGNPPPKAP
ncbi:Crp/Fnr family transcriptional regulator [Acrocarpospora sp. B8E8]|uniref:Crp/Fnr family transcriptional regulator n=1 Tax=Acrocarpospora sp. B8E8 TaxID=3153572 RepID=UPI00325F90FC